MRRKKRDPVVSISHYSEYSDTAYDHVSPDCLGQTAELYSENQECGEAPLDTESQKQT